MINFKSVGKKVLTVALSVLMLIATMSFNFAAKAGETEGPTDLKVYDLTTSDFYCYYNGWNVEKELVGNPSQPINFSGNSITLKYRLKITHDQQPNNYDPERENMIQARGEFFIKNIGSSNTHYVAIRVTPMYSENGIDGTYKPVLDGDVYPIYLNTDEFPTLKPNETKDWDYYFSFPPVFKDGNVIINYGIKVEAIDELLLVSPEKNKADAIARPWAQAFERMTITDEGIRIRDDFSSSDEFEANVGLQKFLPQNWDEELDGWYYINAGVYDYSIKLTKHDKVEPGIYTVTNEAVIAPDIAYTEGNQISNYPYEDWGKTTHASVSVRIKVPGTTTPPAITVNTYPDLNLAKADGGKGARKGDNIEYTLTVENKGDAMAQNVMIYEFIPEGTSFVKDKNPGWLPDDYRYVYSLGTLYPGEKKEAKFILKVNPDFAGNEVINNAEVKTSDLESYLNNNTAQTKTSIIIERPDVKITKTCKAVTSKPGDIVEFVLDVENIGNIDAGNVRVYETLPANTAFDASNTGWEAKDNFYVLQLGTMKAGEKKQVKFYVKVTDAIPEGQSTLINTALVESDGLDLNTANNESKVSFNVEKAKSAVPVLPVTGSAVPVGAAGAAGLVLLAAGIVLKSKKH